jgi:DNA-directed RNA polymerase subunit RPC12/RpoP
MPENLKSQQHSEADLARFQTQFRLHAQRVTRLRIVLGGAILAFFTSCAGCFILGAIPTAARLARACIPLGFLSFAVALAALVGQRRLKCPACGLRLFDRFGPWCPECGSRSLGSPDPDDIVPRYPCAGCGRKFRWGKGGNAFRLRYCSHCGIFLDKQGLKMP